MSRAAAIDLGTNTVRILVAEPDGGGFNQLFSDQVITRLGEGMGASGRLRPEAVERTAEAVEELLRRAASYKPFRLAVTATSAAREAANTDELAAAIREASGAALRVISWEEEARLTLLGASLAVGGAGRFVLFDIGGGSTEFILAEEGRPASFRGSDLGVVRLAETYITKHPVVDYEYGRMLQEISGKVDEAFTGLEAGGGEELVGVAGTVTSLAAIDLNMVEYSPARVNNHRLTAGAVGRIKERLFAMTLKERARIPSLKGGREDLIVPGVAIVESVMARAGSESVTVSDYSLREGIILDMARTDGP
ncbi:MAG: Ppx/GppA phosphatase family protein [Candidatus Nitrospinota bacterium M3_3B_026]